MFLAVWPCAAAVEEIVGEGYVILRRDVQVVDLESRRPRTLGETGFPVLLVCIPIFIAAVGPLVVFLAAYWGSARFRAFVLAIDLPLATAIKA